MTPTTQQAEQEGRDAVFLGLDISENPYRYGARRNLPAAHAWAAGWMAATEANLSTTTRRL